MTKLENPPYKCNVCDIPRERDVNHWFVLVTNRALTAVTIYRWQPQYAAMEGAAHACGRDHSSILFARWMDHGTFDELAPTGESHD